MMGAGVRVGGARAGAALAATLVAAALVATSCATTSEEPFVSNPASGNGSAQEGSATAAEPDPSCDPDNQAASLAPTAPLADLNIATLGGRVADIRTAGTLRAGVGADTLLFGYVNPQTAELEGFDVEIARLVAGAILGSPDRIELIPVQSPERIPLLQEGAIDIVVKTMTITCARWGEINFSSTYYEAGQKLLVSTDSEVASIDDLSDETICAVSGTTSLQRLIDNGVATAESDSWTGCLVKFQRGEASGVSTDDTILAGLAAQDPYAQVVGPAFSSEPYGIGLPPGEDELTRVVNAVLEEARTDGTWRRLYDEWLAETLGSMSSAPSASYRP